MKRGFRCGLFCTLQFTVGDDWLREKLQKEQILIWIVIMYTSMRLKAQNVPVINATLPAKGIPPAAILDFFTIVDPSYTEEVWMDWRIKVCGTKKKCTSSKKHNLRSWETIKNEDDENWKKTTTKQRNKTENKYAEVECMIIQDPWLIFFLSRNDVFPTSCVSFPKTTFASRFNSLLPWVKLLEIWKG